jgi:geranylgeranyl diphosphate synthase type I
MPELPAAVAMFRAEVENELRASLSGDRGTPGLYKMLHYHLGWLDSRFQPETRPTGKFLRPAVCLLAAQAVGGDHRKALPAAAALELLHNFSLIHDDVQDRSDERHHRPTVWRLFGDAQAIDAGDAMLAAAQLTLLRAESVGAPAVSVIRGVRLLNEACLRLAEGQHLDISFEGKLDVSEPDYLTMVGGKTASVLGCSFALGALFGSDDPDLADRYGQVGYSLGIAFQIQDDILGIWGASARTGKPTAADVYARKMTLPVILAMAAAQRADRAVLTDAYGGIETLNEVAVSRVLDVLDRTKVRARCAESVRQYHEAALTKLDSLRPLPGPAAALRAIADFLAARDF